MARAKRPSDERYNARRRIKRALARAERSGDFERASMLRAQVEASYAKNKIGRSVLQGSAPVAEPTVTQPRASRPKRLSDELYNARRRLRRQAAHIEREAAKAETVEKDLALGYAKYLRQQAQAGAKLTEEQQKQALERLGSIRANTKGVTYDPFRVRRRNAIIMQQLNAAGTEGAESNISERRKDVFWAATKGLWPKGANVPRNERYDLILSHFYSDNTTDAQEFREWLEREKGTNAQESFGDLQLVYEYITEELNNPDVYDMPDLPYQSAMDLIKTAM